MEIDFGGPVIRDPEDQMVARMQELNRYKQDWLAGLVQAQIEGGRKNRIVARRAAREIRSIDRILGQLTAR